MSRLVGVFVALSLVWQGLVGSAVATAADIAPANGSFLFTACRDSAGTVSPLGPRPVVARRTLASPLPHRPVHRHPRPHRRRPVAHRPVIHRKVVAHRPRHVVHRHAVPHRGRPVYHKVTYASPLCFDRAPVINTLLNDLGIPEFQPIAAPFGEAGRPLPVVPLVSNYPVPPGIAPGGVPQVPGFPIGGGGGGGGPCCGGVVTPPITAVPEPATWLLIVGGFALIGFAARRRRRGRRIA